MNCKKTAQLIPLFVEADLDTAAMQQVNQHLEKCISCHVIVNEFRASQSSLRAVVLPDFEEAMMARLRTAVNDEIARPTDVPHWLLNWSWKFAAATTVLILISGIVMYRRGGEEKNVTITRFPVNPASLAFNANQNDVSDRPAQTRRVPQSRTWRQNKAQGGVSISERDPGNNATNLLSSERTIDVNHQIVAVAPSEANDQSASIASFMPPPASQAENTTAITTPSSEKPSSEPEMLRIELQTTDPNIRIIWFASKETIAANTKADLR